MQNFIDIVQGLHFQIEWMGVENSMKNWLYL